MLIRLSGLRAWLGSGWPKYLILSSSERSQSLTMPELLPLATMASLRKRADTKVLVATNAMSMEHVSRPHSLMSFPSPVAHKRPYMATESIRRMGPDKVPACNKGRENITITQSLKAFIRPRSLEDTWSTLQRAKRAEKKMPRGRIPARIYRADLSEDCTPYNFCMNFMWGIYQSYSLFT